MLSRLRTTAEIAFFGSCGLLSSGVLGLKYHVNLLGSRSHNLIQVAHLINKLS